MAEIIEIIENTEIAPLLPDTSPNEPENQSDAAASPAVQTSVTEKVLSAGGRILEKAGLRIKKPGRGRPRADGQPKISDILEEAPALGALPAQADLPASHDTPVAALFRRVCVSAVKGSLKILEDITGVMARACGISEPFAQKTLDRARPSEADLNEFTESLDLVLKKYNVQPKHAEEIALAISGAKLLAPYGLLIVEFRAELARVREQRIQDVTARHIAAREAGRVSN